MLRASGEPMAPDDPGFSSSGSGDPTVRTAPPADAPPPDTDLATDDITTMTTGELAGGGTDGLEVGRAPDRVDPIGARQQPIDLDDHPTPVAQVETALPAIVESPLELMHEPELIEYEPPAPPEPELDLAADDVLDDDLDD